MHGRPDVPTSTRQEGAHRGEQTVAMRVRLPAPHAGSLGRAGEVGGPLSGEFFSQRVAQRLSKTPLSGIHSAGAGPRRPNVTNAV
jgi:hypothetical protein